MMVVMKKKAKNAEITAVIKNLKPLETYVSKVNGRKIIVVN